MADVKLTAEEKSERNYRLDHPDFGDVYETTYGKGVILDFGLLKDAPGGGVDPILLDGTCTVATEKGTFSDVPIFYHCRGKIPKGAPPPPKTEWDDILNYLMNLLGGLSTEPKDDGANTLESNGSLRRGAWAFLKGQEVKVLLQKGKPKYVVGHIPYIPAPTPRSTEESPWFEKISAAKKALGVVTAKAIPRKCHNVFAIRCNPWFFPAVKQGFIYSLMSLYGGMSFAANPPLKDQYMRNLDLNLTEKAYRLFGYREFQRGLMMLFCGDWLIKLGPVMFIFMVESIGLPGPMTTKVTILAALYDKALEKATIAQGKIKETLIPGVFHHGGWFGDLPTIKYAGFVKQTAFTEFMSAAYGVSTGKVPTTFSAGIVPRWVTTEIFTEPMGYPI